MHDQLDLTSFCSRRDPLKEARAWFELQRPFLRYSDEVILLGLGVGWHLQQILNSEFRLATLLVVEKHQELVDLWKAQNPKLSTEVQFIPVNQNFHQNLIKFATVLEFRPAWTGNEKFYSKLTKELIGGPITEVMSELSVQEQTQDAKIWRALRELVQ